MPSELPRITLRMEEEIIEKLKIIAKNNERSLNQEITYTIKKMINEYEKENGKIKPESSISKIG